MKRTDQKKLLETEKNIYDFWEKSDFFRADPLSKKKPYSILTPPPNLTGELHLGHAMQHSILDALARFKRLQGFDVLLLPGVDHAGILFEATLNRDLSKQNLSKEKLGREEWLKRAWKFKEEVYKSVSSTWRFMGLSADWSREVFTLDPGPQKAVFEEFKTYFERGLIYKGPYIVLWCPKCNTAIEDVEMEYEEREEKLYFIKYFVAQHPRTGKSGSDFIEVATTRPETIFADVAIAVHPNDERYKKYWGINGKVHRPNFLEPAKSPVSGELRIVRDKRVDPKFGSGALKITPGHDLLDYEIGKDNKLPIITVVDKDGRLNEVAGIYAGMKVMEARQAIVKKLEEQNLLSRPPQDYVHNVAVCERCKSVVEPLISEEWFVKVDELAKGAIKVIKTNKIKFLPKNYAKILTDWLSNIHDWCISRSLWWGHRIPIWYKKGTPKSGISFSSDQMVKDKPARMLQAGEVIISLESPGPEYEQDEQVLDTWFSSGLWPLSTLGWPFDSAQDKPSDKKPGLDPQLAKYYPWDFELTAPEIKFLWIARMIMIGQYFIGDVPFKTMFFHGMLRDLKGRKFSKSLGNGIEPTYLIDKWGVDATRMALYTYSIPGRDGRVSREILDERGKNFRNFGTKIRNVAKFILELKPMDNVILSENEESKKRDPSFLTQDDSKTEQADDKWIKAQLDETVKLVTKNFEEIKLHLASEQIYDFIWHKFADVYIENSKKRRAQAQPVLEYVLKTCLIILHPFMPFVTEEIYQKFDKKEKSIMLENWPTID